jgi:hypothetical protein
MFTTPGKKMFYINGQQFYVNGKGISRAASPAGSEASSSGNSETDDDLLAYLYDKNPEFDPASMFELNTVVSSPTTAMVSPAAINTTLSPLLGQSMYTKKLLAMDNTASASNIQVVQEQLQKSKTPRQIPVSTLMQKGLKAESDSSDMDDDTATQSSVWVNSSRK